MIQALVLIEAEPSRIPELLEELPELQLASSTIECVYGVTGRYDLVALVESPDLQSLGD